MRKEVRKELFTDIQESKIKEKIQKYFFFSKIMWDPEFSP